MAQNEKENAVCRRTFIGGSDIAACMGLSRWQTPLQLWAEKVGEVEPTDLSGNEAVQLGVELEEFCAGKFERITGIKVRRAPQIYTHKLFPHFKCQVDRLIQGTDELLEIKTCSAWKQKEWEGEEIPVEYVLQVMWQLMVTGRSVGWICVLIGGQKFRHKKIVADPEMFAKMTEAANLFWDMVQKRIPPVAEADDKSFMVNLYPHASGRMLEATTDIITSVDFMFQLKREIEELVKQKEEIEARLEAAIGSNLGLDTPKYIIKWSEVPGSTFTVNRKPSRVLRITKKEK
jgi:putative phage-type endonuclease